MNNKEKYTDKDWEKFASLLSDETTYSSEELHRFREEDHLGIERQWKDMGTNDNNKEIDVDKAWDSIYSRIEESGLLSKKVTIEKRFRIKTRLEIIQGVCYEIKGFFHQVLYRKTCGI
jgi:hypothetical protein